jgi:recombination protein RecT
VQEQFKNALKENSGAFVSSLIELYSGDSYLQNCNPKEVVQQALRAASLKLPINKNLGFAWIIPRKERGVLRPNFDIGYKGYIQLAMRTGQYRTINADAVPVGYDVEKDLLSGSIKFSGSKTADEAQGYFAHFELLNGFQKTLYMTKDEIEKYAKDYSQSFSSKYSPWKKHFDKMAKKTVLSLLLRTYGIMSTEMIGAIAADTPEYNPEDESNSENLDFPDAEIVEDEKHDPETGEIKEENNLKPDGFEDF